MAAHSKAWVQIPPGTWKSVSGVCCVLAGGGLCEGLITNREVSTECGVSECDREASMRRPWSTRGCCAMGWGGREGRNEVNYVCLLCVCISVFGARGGVVVKALRYKPARRGFDSRWCHRNFRSHYGPGVDSASNRNEYQVYFLGVKAGGARG